MARDAADVAKVLAYGRAQRDPGHLPRRRHQPQRPGPERRHPRRRAPPLRRRRGRGGRERWPGSSPAPCSATPTASSPRTGASSAPTRPAPTSPRVGGVIANNSGGMRCGTTKDSYSTVRSLTFVLPSGTTIDTAAPGAAERFAAAEPELAAGLAAIRDEIRADAELSERIRRKFAIKNTTGYRLCAFLDADEPLEIFRRLVGRLRGHARLRRRGGLRDGAAAGPHDHRLGPLPRHRRGDRPGPRAGRRRRHRGRADGRPGADHRRLEHGRRARRSGKSCRRSRRCCWSSSAPRRDAELDAYVAKAGEILAAHETIRPIDFTREPEEIELAWRVREGLHGLIGKLRLPGTALIVEDVCVPPRADRRGRPRPAGAARRARLPARRRRPRLGRQPPLHAHPGLRQAGGPRALRGLHVGAGRADRRQVRRLAQGRARDRDQHGPLCGARVGGAGDRADVAGEAAGRSRRRALPRRRPQPRPRRPPAQPEDDAADRGVGDAPASSAASASRSARAAT